MTGKVDKVGLAGSDDILAQLRIGSEPTTPTLIFLRAFLMAAAVSFRIAKDLGPSITNEDWDSVPSKTRALISDSRTWRTFALIIFFLLLGALIEAYVTDIVYWWVKFGVPPP